MVNLQVIEIFVVLTALCFLYSSLIFLFKKVVSPKPVVFVVKAALVLLLIAAVLTSMSLPVNQNINLALAKILVFVALFNTSVLTVMHFKRVIDIHQYPEEMLKVSRIFASAATGALTLYFFFLLASDLPTV